MHSAEYTGDLPLVIMHLDNSLHDVACHVRLEAWRRKNWFEHMMRMIFSPLPYPQGGRWPHHYREREEGERSDRLAIHAKRQKRPSGMGKPLCPCVNPAGRGFRKLIECLAGRSKQTIELS